MTGLRHHAQPRHRHPQAHPRRLRPLCVLIVGAAIMILPFLYMLSTSFKSQAFVLSLPPQFIPHPATVEQLHRGLDLVRLRAGTSSTP